MSNVFKPNLSFKSPLLRITMAILLLFAMPALAQEYKITGKVLDNTKQTIPGASVQVKGKSAGAATDLNGVFSIKVSKGDVLVVSYIGYKTKETLINSSAPVEIVLEEDNTRIDEVVVVGYGTMKKSDLTGAIASVKRDDLTKRATSSAAEAIQGRISGVNIQKSGGNAGASIQVKIRGVNTFGSNEPLYIIDGFPGSINSVNPSDIESMEVLKDGAASAIYGSIAANGVVLITTKKAKEGKIVVDFNSYLNFKSIDNKLELLDANGYVQVLTAAYKNANRNLPAYLKQEIKYNTDWQDAVFRSGFAQNYNLNVTGGQDNLKFALSSNYNTEKGVIIGNEVNSKNVRMKINFKKSIFEVDANVNYIANRDRQPQFSLKEVYMISPLMPIYDSNEQYGYALTLTRGLPSNRNVMADAHFKDAYTDGQKFTGNVSLAANFTSWLQLKTSYSYSNNNYQSFYHAPAYIADAKSPNTYPYNSDSRTYWQEQLWDNILSINKTIGSHSLNLMLGSSTTVTESNWNSINAEGSRMFYYIDKGGNIQSTKVSANVIDENFDTIDGFEGGIIGGGSSKSRYNRLSLFSRINYNYANRYLLQVTFRRDGSSKFGRDNRWASFPSVALGWKISEEEFFPRNSIVNALKLRTSYGKIGNEASLKNYEYIPTLSVGNNLWYGYLQDGNPWVGATNTTLINNKLRWETTESYNIGFDFGLFSNKLTGTINYFDKTTKNLLIPRIPETSSGYDSQITNVGEIKNNGIEAELNYSSSFRQFKYNVGFNISFLKNEVKKLYDVNQTLYGRGLKYGTEHFPTQTVAGHPVASYKLYQTDGIFQSMAEVNAYQKNGVLIQPNAKPGDIRFKDINGDGVITPEDQVFCGSGIPKVEANLSFNGSYSNFDISFLVGSGWGHKLYNANRYFYEGMSSGSNLLASTRNAWTPTNTNTSIPRPVFGDPNGNTRESDRFLESGDFVRLRQIQLGYNFSKTLLKKAGIDNLRIYASGENLYTWTKYSGTDPEFGNDILNTGVDTFIYPFTKSYVVGIQFTF